MVEAGVINLPSSYLIPWMFHIKLRVNFLTLHVP